MLPMLILSGMICFIYDQCYSPSFILKKNKINILLEIIVLSTIVPIQEEMIFRGKIYQWTSDMVYYKEINAVLFGLMHLINYVIYQDVIRTFLQVINATIMGYYFISLNNINLAIGLHCIWNFLILNLTHGTLWLREKKFKQNPQTSIDICVQYNTLKKCKSCSDIIDPYSKSNKQIKIISTNQIDNDLVNSFKKFNKQEQKLFNMTMRKN